MIDYTNSEITALIVEHVHSERDRALLLRRWVDGICFEPLSEEFGLSVRQTKNIVYKYEKILVYYLYEKRHPG